MKKIILLNIAGISIGVIVAILFSILGHYQIWIFKNFLNDNLFIVSIINLGIAFLVKPFSPQETGKGFRDFSTAIKIENIEDNRVRGKLSTLLFFVIISVILSALSFFLPEIRL